MTGTHLVPALVARLAMLIAIVTALVVPFQSAPSIALATHTLSTTTPTPTPWPYSQYQAGGMPTATQTPFGYSQYQPAQGQTQYQGSSTTTYPGSQGPTYSTGTGQQSVTSGTGQQSVTSGTGQQSVTSGTGQQSVTSGTGQQSVSSPSYGGAPAPGMAPAPGGLPGNVGVAGAASPMPGGSDVCYGDELITFSPEAPRIGNELLIAVTSARPHPYGRLAGTEPTQFVRERPGQRGIVWEWTVQPSYPGDHEYTFFVDSTIPCQKIQLRVQQSLSTRTPTPTKTATPYNWNENSNGNGNSNTNDNNSFVFPTSSAFAPAVDPSFYVSPGQDLYSCSSFDSQSNAQRVLRYDPSDPNNLDVEDGSVDGIACFTWFYASYPADRDTTPVPRVTQTPTLTPAPIQTATPTRTPTQTLTPTPVPFNPANYVSQGDHYSCRDFASQAQAQAVLRFAPSDPNRLDTNPRDGLACGGIEAAADGVPAGMMPPPFDGVRVPR